MNGTKNTNNATENPWNPSSSEPLYIEESEGFSLLRKVYNFENLKTQKGFFLCS